MRVTKIIFNLLLFSCISSAFKLLPFNTLTEILNYQKAISEYPKIDNQDYINPDFSSFYKESEQSLVNRLITKALNFLKVKKELWSPEQFNSLLKKVSELQEKNWGTGDYVIKNTPVNKTKFVIWGDIQGAFHSLARDLSKLKDENYLDGDLKILNPDSFFIFNGNAIGRSAYIMETLTIILSLMEKNPKQVIYIKGEQELNDNWKNFGLEQELRNRAKRISKENIPLENEITKFLNTLPLALYIKLPSDKIQKFIRISYFDRNFIKLNEFLFSEFLQKNSGNNVDVLKLADKKASDQQINIEAIIEGKDRSLQYQKTDGLQLLLPDKGATAWSILSSPTLSSQKLYNFSNDAFAILTVDPKEKLNLITLYKQNAIELKGFSTKTYNLLSEELIKEEAVKVEKAATKEEKITIGSSLDLFGVSYIGVIQIYQGINLFFKKLNSSGGIKGKEINYIVLNDQYQPTLAIKNINTFLDVYKTNVILVIGGTPTTKAVLPRVEAKEILVAFPFSGASIFRKPELTNFIHMKTSYEKECFALTDYAINQMKLTKFAILYQDDDFGQECLKGTKEALEKNNIKNWLQTPHKNDTEDIEVAAKKIIDFNPQAIMLFSREKPSLYLIDQLGAAASNKTFFAGSYMFDEFKEQLNKKGTKIVLSNMVPNPKGTDLEIQREYQKDMQQMAGKEISYNMASLTGYIYAAVFSELLKRIDGEITKEKIIEQAEKIKNENFKGLTLNFDPQTRELFKEIWINTLEDKWIKPGEAEVAKPIQKEIPKPGEKREIQVGLNMDLTNILALETKPTIDGILDYLREENKINKTTNFKLTILDNKLDTKLIESNTEKLLETGIKIFLQPTGSMILEKMLPILKDKAVFILNGTQSPIFRKPDLKNLINYFPSSFQSSSILTDYLIEKYKDRKIAIIYQLEPYGQGAYEGCLETFKKNNLKENEFWKAFGHAVGKTEDSKLIDSIRKFNPEIIFIASYDTAIKDLIKNLGADFLINKIIAIPDLSDEIKSFAHKQNLSYVSTQMIPDLNTNSFELVKKYRNILGNKKPDERYFEGYFSASLLVNFINKTSGEITPQKLLETAENIKNQDLKGFTLNFNPQTRSIFTDVWIDPGDGKAFLYKPKTEKMPSEKVSTVKRNIAVGSNLDLTAVMAEDSKPMVEGILSAFHEENKISETNNIKFTYYDNKFQIDLIKEYAQKMLDNGINIFLQPTGSFILEKMLPMIKDKPIFMLCGATSPIFREPELKNFINYLPSSFQSAKTLAEYLIGKLNKRKIAVIYQLEPYGQGAFDGCEYVFKKYNLKKDTDWLSFGHQAEEISNPKVVDAIKKFNPDALIFATYDAALRDLVNNLGADFLFKKTIGTIEISGGVKDFFIKKHISFISTQLVPDAQTSDLEIAKECIKKIGHEEISPRALEGCVGASILVYLINKVEGEVTPQKLLNIAENLKNEKFKGLVLNFDSQSRSILSDVWISTGDGKAFIYKETEEEKKEITAPLKSEEVAKSKKEVLVGTTLDLSKSNSVWGKAILSGLNLSINKANREGGINGKNIKLIHFDNKNDPKIAREDAENILIKGSDLILHPVGNLTIEAYLPLAKENKLAIIFSASSAATLYKPEPRNMTSFYPSSKDAGKVISEYAIKEHNMRKIAVFFQTEPYSLSALEGAKEVFNNYNLIEGKDWIAVSHIPDSLNLTQATNRIKEFNPSAIFMFSVYSPNQALINQLGTNFLYNKILFGLESDGKIINSIRKQNLKFATTQLLPNPEYDLKIAQEYRAEKNNKDLNDTEFGAFIACEIFIDILRKMKEPITKEKILEAIENIKNYNFRGINLNFDPNTRKILQDVWINKVDGLLISYKIPESKIIEQAVKPEDIKKVETPLLQGPTLEKKAEKMTNNEIKVGCTLDQNGKTAEYIKTFAIGLKTKISKVNSTGGINGKTISLIIRDDEFSPGKAAENIEKFLSEDKTDIILSPFGSFPFTQILPFVKEQKIAVFFPEATSQDYQKNEYKNLVTCFGSSYLESKVLFEYIINKLKLKKIAIFYEEEPFSQGAFNGAKSVLEKSNLKENIDWKVFPRDIQAKSTNASTKEIIEILQNFDPDGIALLSLHSTTQALILDIPRDYLASKKCFGISSMSKIKKMLEDRGLRFISTQLVPDPINSTLELVKEYRKDMSEKGISLDTYSLEGYFAASIFVNLLRKIEGNITKEKILEQAEKIKNEKFKGLTLNFDSETRNIFGCVFLDTKEGEPILYKPEIEKPKEISVEKPIEIKPVITPTSKEPPTEKTVAATIPTTKEDFVVGNSMDLSKGGAHWGKADLKGILLSINKTNREGGVNGRKMKLINYDDKNDPNLAFENVQNLIKKEIDFIIHPFGGTSIQKYLSLIKENKIAVIFSASSDDTLYKPEPKYLTNFFLSAKDTAKTITEYAIKELNLKKIAVFYEMDSYSQSALDGAIEIFKKFNLQEGKDWISEGHQSGVTDVLPSANKIKDFLPQGILLFSVYQAHTSLVDLLGAAFLNGKILLPLESDGEIIDALKKRNFKFATTQTLPSIDSDIEAAKQFKEELKKQADDKTLKFLDTTFSAFVATELFVDIVKNLQKSITKENVIDAIEKIKDRDFRGIKMDFNPLTRAIFKNCYIYTTDGKVIPYNISPQANPSIATPASAFLPTASKRMAKSLKGSTLVAKKTNTRFINNKKLQKRRLLAQAK